MSSWRRWGLSCSFRLKAEVFKKKGIAEFRSSKERSGRATRRLPGAATTSQAIEEVAEAGFKGIQLRASAFDKWGTRPGEPKDLLAKRGLTFAVLSSGNLKYQPASRGAQIDLHLSHAKFVRDAGGQMLQVIDEKPKDRPVTGGRLQGRSPTC